MISTCKSNEKIILCNGFTCVKEGEYYGVKIRTKRMINAFPNNKGTEKLLVRYYV